MDTFWLIAIGLLLGALIVGGAIYLSFRSNSFRKPLTPAPIDRRDVMERDANSYMSGD